MCREEWTWERPEECRIITSDDVFDYMLDLRSLNEGIDRKREDVFREYLDLKDGRKGGSFRMQSLDDYEQLKKVSQARRYTQSRYTRENLMNNARERSNGESAFLYFTHKIQENGLYTLDEPENSLSPERQRELVSFIEDSVRFFRCQFIISTHSPFLLALKGARIYDMDETPVAVQRWTELKNVRQYYEFFREHEREFESYETRSPGAFAPGNYEKSRTD